MYDITERVYEILDDNAVALYLNENKEILKELLAKWVFGETNAKGKIAELVNILMKNHERIIGSNRVSYPDHDNICAIRTIGQEGISRLNSNRNVDYEITHQVLAIRSYMQWCKQELAGMTNLAVMQAIGEALTRGEQLAMN